MILYVKIVDLTEVICLVVIKFIVKCMVLLTPRFRVNLRFEY